jgi:hypothetical protein
MTPAYFAGQAAVNLAKAIRVMRDACDKAEREVAGGSTACRRVLHELTWGLANATSSIESAMSNVEDARIAESLQPPPKG